MTTTAYSTVLSTTNDVEFHACVQEYHDSLVTIGLTQTSDTGQINPATVNKPTVNNTSAGYEIWRFNATTGNQPSKVWFTIGTGSDVAGNITGISVGNNANDIGFSTCVGGSTNNYTTCMLWE